MGGGANSEGRQRLPEAARLLLKLKQKLEYVLTHTMSICMSTAVTGRIKAHNDDLNRKKMF